MKELLKSLWKRVIIAIAVMGALVILFFFLDNNTLLFSSSGDFECDDTLQSIEATGETPIEMYGMIVNHLHVSQDRVKRDQRFTDLFSGHFVRPQVQQQLNLVPRDVFDFRRISAGCKYTLISADDSLLSAKALVYESNPIDYIVFHLQDSLIIEECHREVKTLEKSVTGEIRSSLFETISELGISPELTNKFVDIFAWQVDFQRLQKGDKFKIIYEEDQVENTTVSIGKIFGIYFEHFGSPYYAFPYDQGDGIDYFDEDGKSLRKALLKYPIEFTRISSRYNLNRFHPVAKVFRAHLGTDFAAPQGTPIRSVGDGVVEEAQYKANNGNYVKIRHNGTYSTAYLHMSKIASGIVAGTRVRQGQNIGFVGSTGLATGPHVCYRFWRNGVQVDALRVELPPSQPVRPEYFAGFQCVRDEIAGRLQQIPFIATPPSGAIAAR